jgi:hypothetical protein
VRLEELKNFSFGIILRNEKRSFWDTSLVRYLDDKQIVQILHEVKNTISDRNAKKMVEGLLEKDFSNVTIQPASGARVKKSLN